MNSPTSVVINLKLTSLSMTILLETIYRKSVVEYTIRGFFSFVSKMPLGLMEERNRFTNSKEVFIYKIMTYLHEAIFSFVMEHCFVVQMLLIL